MLKDSIIDTLAYVGSKLAQEPLTYINTTTAVVSVSTLQDDIKSVFYIVSIIASVLVSVKYVMEIIKLKKESDDTGIK